MDGNRPAEKNSGVQRLAGVVALCLATFFLWGCAGTFLISKDCKTHIFGDPGESLRRTLCDSGDLRAVLDDSGLPAQTRDDFFRYQCSEPIKEKVTEVYRGLSQEQKKALKSSFRQHGYDINYKPAPNFRLDYDTYGPEFCPPEAN